MQKSLPYLWPKWRQNSQNRYPIYDQNGWKTLPFGAAHTYIAHIREYPPPRGFAPQEEKSTSISTYRPSTYLLVITIGHGVQATTKRFCSIAVLCVSFTRQIVKTRVIIFPVIANPNARVQIEFCAFHSFLVEVQARHLSYLKLRQIRINSLCHSESVISHSTEVRGVEEH